MCTPFISWAQAAALLAPYPGLFKDDAFRSAFPEYYDMDQLETAFADNSLRRVGPGRPLVPTFRTAVGDRIQAMLIGDASVDDTITGLADDAVSAADSV